MPHDIDALLRDIAERGKGCTRSAAQPPREDEMLAAEIHRLRAELQKIIKLDCGVTVTVTELFDRTRLAIYMTVPPPALAQTESARDGAAQGDVG